ncbi:MAG: anthranilate phosphoribosyltransferase [Gammaproteobacteria bacterium]|jgi:anthranilate phosphoribosyltransferase
MDMQGAIHAVTEARDLSAQDMTTVMRTIMTGDATAAQIGGFLVGLRMKGETEDEIAAAAKVMRELATPVDIDVPHLVDTCGTGGDGASTFNISTASAFVAAAAGAHVAKHGNRSVSSSSGSADLLEAAGVKVDLSADQVAQCIREVGVGFMFAPLHHGAMRHAIGPRREMGVRTVFNVLGPLTNPAGAPNQVVGVFSGEMVEPLARVLGQLGSNRVLVVHADDGLDEISIASPTQVAEWNDGDIRRYEVQPEHFGLQRASLSDITAIDAQDSLRIVRAVFDGQAGAARDIVCLNAGAALYACSRASSLENGVELAAKNIDSGEAGRRLNALVSLSQSFGQ